MIDRLSPIIAIILFLTAADVIAGRTEFIVHKDGERISDAEVCFVKAAVQGAHPSEYSFFSNDIRCLPADRLLEMPTGRFHFFGRAQNFISPAHLSVRIEQIVPEAFKRVGIPVVPSGTLDISSTPLKPAQFVVVLVASGKHGRGAILPVTTGEKTVAVPAGIPLLPMIVEERRPVRIGEPVIVAQSKVGRAEFVQRKGDDVVTWMEFDPAFRQKHPIASPLFGRASTTLVTGNGTRISPVFSLAHPPALHGELQVFRDVPAGEARVVIEGDHWEEREIRTVIGDGSITLTEKPLLAVPAGSLTIRYSLPPSSLNTAAARQQACVAGSSEVAPITMVLSLCIADETNGAPDKRRCSPVRTREMPLDLEVSVVLSRLPTGEYHLETRHPILGNTRSDVTVKPAEESAINVTPPAFPIYGRVTRAGQPVRAELRFAQGTRGAGTAVTDESGQYEILLPRDPKTNPIEVHACDKSFEYVHEMSDSPPPNVALNLEVPATTVEVTVRDAVEKSPVEGAVVFCRRDETSGRGPMNARRAVTDSEGVARFTAIPAKASMKACASAQPQGYVTSMCSDVFNVVEDDITKVELALNRDGQVQGRLVSTIALEPPIVALVGADGSMRARIFVEDGVFWLREPPAPTDYFIVSAPKQPLYVLPWSMVNDVLIVTVPQAVRVRSIAIRGPDPEADRFVAVSVGGRRVPAPLLGLHLMNRGINPLTTWTAGLVLPGIAETGQIAISLSPAARDLDVLGPSATDIFTRPEFANRLPIAIVPPDRDEVVFGR